MSKPYSFNKRRPKQKRLEIPHNWREGCELPDDETLERLSQPAGQAPAGQAPAEPSKLDNSREARLPPPQRIGSSR